MKAFVVERYGRGTVRAAEVPEPTVGARDVLVEVRAAGVNPLDSKLAAGEFKRLLPYRLPFILGHDLAGVVVGVGAAVERFKPGDEVYARPADLRIGTFAERIAVKEEDLALKPASLSMEEAAAVPLVALTAWQALVEKADVRPAQKVLVHAGAGGVGNAAIQLAKHLGAIVATTTSGANVDFVRALGADVVVDYRQHDFATELDGYDVVLDPLGAENLERSLRVLRPGGIAISIAGPPDPDFARAIGANLFIQTAMRLLSFRVRRHARRLNVRYSFMLMRASGEQLTEIRTLVDAGAVRPVVDRTFSFARTIEALAYVDAGRTRGKIVISMES